MDTILSFIGQHMHLVTAAVFVASFLVWRASKAIQRDMVRRATAERLEEIIGGGK